MQLGNPEKLSFRELSGLDTAWRHASCRKHAVRRISLEFDRFDDVLQTVRAVAERGDF